MTLMTSKTTKLLSWLNFALGVWLLISAFIFPANVGPVMAAESIAGVLIAVLAYASAVGRPSAGVSWSVAIAGLWALIINYGVRAVPKLNATIVGILVVILGSANAFIRHSRPQRHA